MRTPILIGTLFTITSSVVACGGTGDTSPSPHDTTDTAVLQGRLEQGGELVADAVTAHQLQGDGLVSVADGAVTIAGGSYAIDVTVSDPDAGPIVIQATRGAEIQGSVVVSFDSAADGVITAAPIGAESTAEADVHASAALDLSVTLDAGDHAALTVLVDDTLGETMAASEAHQADVTAMAKSVTAAAVAFEAALDAQLDGSAAQVQAAEARLAQAQSALAAELHGASSEAEAEAAIASFQHAFADAYLDAGFTHEELATAAHAAVESVASFSSDATADVRGAALAQAHGVLAVIVDASVQKHAAAAQLGADAQTELAAAAEDLMAQISGAAEAGAGAETAIDDAWASYGAALEATLEASLAATLEDTLAATLEDTLGGGLDALATTLDTVAGTMQEAEGELAAAIAAAGDGAAEAGHAIGGAQAEFQATSTASSQLELLTAAGQSAAAAAAVLELMVEMTLAT